MSDFEKRLAAIKDRRANGSRILSDWEPDIDWMIEFIEHEAGLWMQVSDVLNQIALRLGVPKEPHNTFDLRLIDAVAAAGCRKDKSKEGESLPDAFGPMSVPFTVDDFYERYAVVTEHDHGDWWKSRGPIVFETYLGDSDLAGVMRRAEKIGEKYGHRMICKLVPIGSPEEVKARINQEAA